MNLSSSTFFPSSSFPPRLRPRRRRLEGKGCQLSQCDGKEGEWNGLEGRRRRRSVGREKRPPLDLLTGWYGHDRREERLGTISRGRGRRSRPRPQHFSDSSPRPPPPPHKRFFCFPLGLLPLLSRPSVGLGFLSVLGDKKKEGVFPPPPFSWVGGGKRGQRLAGLTKREKEGANGLHPPFLAGGGGRVEEEQEEVEEEEEEAISEPGNDKQITPLPLFLPRFLPRFISPCRKLVGPLLSRGEGRC